MKIDLVDNDGILAGGDFKVTVNVTNNKAEQRTVSKIHFDVTATTYRGEDMGKVKHQCVENIVLGPNEGVVVIFLMQNCLVLQYFQMQNGIVCYIGIISFKTCLLVRFVYSIMQAKWKRYCLLWCYFWEKHTTKANPRVTVKNFGVLTYPIP